MSHHRNPIGPALASVVLASLSIAAAGSSQGNAVSLTGSWRFDPEKTMAEEKGQPPDPKTREGYASGGRPRVGTGVTEPRGGGQTGGGRTAGEGAGGRVELGPLNIYARPLPELVVMQSDSTITISDPSGRPRSYHLNGRKEVEALLGTDSLEIQARWKGGKLTTERKLGRFGSVREVYSLDSHDNLILEVRLTAPQLTQPMEQRRFYSRKKESN
ncbi:MAG TPA: hypothetical protein VGQ73_08090 [Gemmatimonadales bacterium]|jgi:hypothetical protein|nr:hypothetical protein [Gemmatimonadales bacterium]